MNTCDQWVLCTGRRKAFPFPGLNFSAILPETEEYGVFLVRSEGTWGAACHGSESRSPVQAGPLRPLWSERRAVLHLDFPSAL